MTEAAVIGGGPAGLMAAEVLARAGLAVTVHERMPSVGRKLLLAGRGGLNLTHTEPVDRFLDRYGAGRPALARAIAAFGPDDLRTWCAALGEETFVGSSGRVFPRSFRATPLLRAWLARLGGLGVSMRTRSSWEGWRADGSLQIGGEAVTAEVTVLALGGASWPRVGSDGAWSAHLAAIGVDVRPLRPSNCGFTVAWSPTFAERFAGTPLKNVVLAHGGRTSRGDAVVTRAGIEGGPVYALSASLRDALDAGKAAVVLVDVAPDRSEAELAGRLAGGRAGESAARRLRRAGIADVAAGLLREATGNRVPTDPASTAALLKALPVPVLAPQPLARAISTAGGVALYEVDDAFMLRRRPGTFVAGEMLDWEAPTGGYLLQGAFSTGVAAARGALAWLGGT